jgi:hypothetical protein
VVHPNKAKNSMSYKRAAATVMGALIGDDLAGRSTLISQHRRNEARSWGWITGYTTKAASLPLRTKAGQLSVAGIIYGDVASLNCRGSIQNHPVGDQWNSGCLLRSIRM